MVIFGIDAASYQGRVDWAAEDTACDFGWEKVTQGTVYANPFWGDAKKQMLARPGGFTGGGYLFLEHGNGAAQADHFAAAAGEMTGFGIAIDAEPVSGQPAPTGADVLACAARLRQHYPGRPIGGYFPEWFWGGTNLRAAADYTWASRYVYGFGSPASLYSHVPGSFWAAYGGRAPSLLQFSSTATVPGVAGVCDVSAYAGTAAAYRSLVAGIAAPQPPPGPIPDWQVQMMQALPVVAKGSSGTWVREVQMLCGLRGAPTAVDGAFGPGTDAAVRAVQVAHGLKPDGAVGQLTWPVLVTGTGVL
jgi:lysozyme